jgi:hypothetical protein
MYSLLMNLYPDNPRHISPWSHAVSTPTAVL